MGNLAVEIGAGDGQHAADLVALGWTVHAFEPCTVMRDRAWATLRGVPNVALIPYAIGGNDRTATLYRCDGPDASLHDVGEPVE